MTLNRLVTCSLCLSLLVGCHRPTEIHGMYTSQDGLGTFFPCDDPRTAVLIKDSTLDSQYQALASGHEALFVRLRGIKSRSGSPKGGGKRLFQVQQVLEIRTRSGGECPGVAPPIAPLLPPS